MTKHLYRKALAALALCALLWALPAFAAEALPTPAADGADAAPATVAPDATAAPDTAAAPEAQTKAAANAAPAGRLPGGLTTASGGAALVGVGAYSYVRKQRQEERDRRRAEQQEPIYFENHTQNGTLLPGERDGIE